MAGKGARLGGTWRTMLSVALGVLAAAQLSAGAAWAEPERSALSARETWYGAVISQRPDPRGCLLAATATVANLLHSEHGGDLTVSYLDVWRHYDSLVPGFASDPWAYPQPWGLSPLAERLGNLEAEAVRTYDGDDVDAWLDQGLYPIVYLGGSPTTPSHAVVLLAQDAHLAYFFDPWDGMLIAPRGAFYAALGDWATLLRIARVSEPGEDDSLYSVEGGAAEASSGDDPTPLRQTDLQAA